LELTIWILLCLIAFSDAQYFRIPNIYLATILVISTVLKLYTPNPFDVILWSLASGMTFFFISLVFYFIRAFAPGDVKLLGVVGYWLGWRDFGDVLFWISISTVSIGCLYLINYCIKRDLSIKALVLSYYSVFSVGKANSSPLLIGSELVMPFAPIVVVGLALNSYF
jgi:prepilin peptidase CpaA